MYDALDARSRGIAQYTDESPALQQLIRNFALNVAKWAKLTRNSVELAKIECNSKGDYIAFRITSGGGAVRLLTTNVIKTDMANAAEFLRGNPDALDAIMSLVRWSAPHITGGAKHFETRWKPIEGYLAIKAVYPKPEVVA